MHRIKQFNDRHFVDAAHAIASIVQNPNPEQIIPTVFDPKLGEVIVAVFK